MANSTFASPFLEPRFTGDHNGSLTLIGDCCATARTLRDRLTLDALFRFITIRCRLVFTPQRNTFRAPDDSRFVAATEFGHIAFDETDLGDTSTNTLRFAHKALNIFVAFQMLDKDIGIDADKFALPFFHQMRRTDNQHHLIISDIRLHLLYDLPRDSDSCTASDGGFSDPHLTHEQLPFDRTEASADGSDDVFLRCVERIFTFEPNPIQITLDACKVELIERVEFVIHVLCECCAVVLDEGQ